VPRSWSRGKISAPLAGLPLVRVRSALREFVEAGLVVANDGSYRLREEGRARISPAPDH
jgi:hypothetical protein